MAGILILIGLLGATASTSVAVAAKSPTAASRGCRRALGRAFGQLARLGFAEVDRCQRSKTLGRAERDCTGLRPGTPRSTTYRRWEHRTGAIILTRCRIDDPARTPFPVKDFGNGQLVGDPTLVVPTLGETVEASARELQGASASLSAARTARAEALDAGCLSAIGEARSLVARATMRAATQCQRRLDATATTFGPLDSRCELPASDATVRDAAGRIAAPCPGVSGPDIGTCAPLPECVIDSATVTGIALARLTYGQCGNGIIDGNEECDDGNDDPGDGCNRCVAPTCGNGKVEGDEECDDGNPIDHDTCTECRNPICGDGVIDVGAEACDDGNSARFDGCTDCQSDPIPCSSAGVLALVTIDYDPNFFGDIAGMKVRVRYQTDAVTIPGSLVGPSISQRVRNLTGLTSGSSFSVADRDLLPSEAQPDGVDDTIQTIIAVSPGRIPTGPFEQIRFDCLGAEARASQFACIVGDVVDPFLNQVPDDVTASQLRCTIQIETAPEQ